MKNRYLPLSVDLIALCMRMTCLTLLGCASAFAQSSDQAAEKIPEANPAAEQPSAQDEIPRIDSSGEQGQVSLEDSFGMPGPRDLVLAQRRKALQDTHVDVQLRSFYLSRDRFDGSESEAMALGGYIGFKTGYFRDRLALGATAFTSQRLYGPQDKGGTNLLAPIQQGYTVIGEAYGQYRLAEDIMLTVGRKGTNTSYINESDSRMTPNTFQLAAVQGQKASADGSSHWRFGAGYVAKMKKKTSETFVSMTEAAGVENGVDRGVHVGGFNFQNRFHKSLISVGAINYYSKDLINIFYSEIKYKTAVTNSAALQIAGQYTNQRSVGDNLLSGAYFSTYQTGLKADLDLGNALFTTSWNMNGKSADLQSPWGSFPSYNSVQVQEFNLAGVHSFLVRAAYDFQSVPGLSAYALWVNGSKPVDPGQSAQDEYDLNMEWRASSGAFRGLSVRLRYARVIQNMGGPDLDDFRLIINYDPPSL